MDPLKSSDVSRKRGTDSKIRMRTFFFHFTSAWGAEYSKYREFTISPGHRRVGRGRPDYRASPRARCSLFCSRAPIFREL